MHVSKRGALIFGINFQIHSYRNTFISLTVFTLKTKAQNSFILSENNNNNML